MFAEDTEEFPSFQTIQNLLQFVERVSAVGLRAEGHHVLLTHCLVDFYTVVRYCYGVLSGFPRRLENLENENGHGKVMEHEKLAKSHGIL